jgi:putative FmdB family regulatory protein
MPTYEYECLKCKRVFELRQRISEPALTVCDVCGGEVRRLLSAAPFILKGGGWYVTDYPSESRKQALQSEKSSEKSSDKASDKAADKASDKPAPKAPDKPAPKGADKPASKGPDSTKPASAPAAPPPTKSD